MYNSDKPIENFEDDILGRKNFSKNLGKVILSLTSNDHITIGLYGKWGSGKTSVLNLAVREINRLTNSDSQYNKPIIIKFEPWNFTNNDNLFLQFFNQLKEELKIKENNGIAKNIGEALEAYSDALEFAEVIPQIGSIASILKITGKFTGKKLQDKKQDNSISSTKDKLIKALKSQHKKIIVIIDDIDRLTNEQIRLVFQLVNQVAGFPNMIYLLSMDKDVVVRALESIQECNGEEYLEKIIQVPFFIPKVNIEKVHNLFFYKLDEIIKEKEIINLDLDYWRKIYNYSIKPFINSIRDVNRIINSFKFKYNIVFEEVNFIDMIAITVIQVMKPEIYQWIIENQELICGGSNDYQGVVYAEQEKKKENYIQEFSSIGGEEALKAVAGLFPKLDKEINYHYENISEDELKRNLRIADNDRFNLYFNLDISEIPISRKKLLFSFNKMDLNELNNLFKNLNENNNIISYLKELNSYYMDVPIQRIPIIIEAIYKNMHTFKEEEWKSIICISAKQYAEWCCNNLFERLETSDERFSIFDKIIKRADFMTLESIASEINRVELGYGRLAGKDKKEKNQIITIEHLKMVEVMYVKRIKELIALKVDIFQSDKLQGIVYLWKSFEYESYREYFGEILKEPKNIIRFIVRMASEWNGARGRKWRFSENDYNEFVSKEHITDIINKYFDGDIEVNISDEEERKLASYILNLNLDDFDHVNESDAKEFIEKRKVILSSK